MTIALLILSSLCAIGCAWWNYIRAEQYKRQRDEARKKAIKVEYRDMNELSIMLPTTGESVFAPQRQN